MRLVMALAVLVPAFLVFFFVAPVVPVGRSFVDAGPYCPGGIDMKWTDWQSGGYTLFGIGYRTPPPFLSAQWCH